MIVKIINNYYYIIIYGKMENEDNECEFNKTNTVLLNFISKQISNKQNKFKITPNNKKKDKIKDGIKLNKLFYNATITKI